MLLCMCRQGDRTQSVNIVSDNCYTKLAPFADPVILDNLGGRMAVSGYSQPRIPIRVGPLQSCLRILILALGWTGACHAGPEFELVNQLRVEAGLPELMPDPVLSEAAARHAAYLDRHREPGRTGQGLSAHEQRPGDVGFSGVSPAARALAVGYPHRQVFENVSMGYADADAAVSGLMQAVYHRLTFLDLTADSMGLAVGERSRVFLLGRGDISRLCASPPAQALSRPPVDCLGRLMTRDHYERLCEGLPDSARFRAPHPVNCPNGRMLDAGYMERACEEPPRAARFRGHGRYYKPCENDTLLAADWFLDLCERPPTEAAYPASGSYYEICDPPVRVHAEWLEGSCTSLPDVALYTDSGRYRRPCGQDTDIRVEYLDALDALRHRELPEMVVWPPDGAEAVPPAFFIEEPDPLPDLSVSGYPVTVQFNPALVTMPVVERFELFRLDDGVRTAVRPVRLLDRATDPNRILDAYEFALFPLQRLDWGSTYLAVVEARIGEQRRRIAWRFETRGKDLPLLIADQAVQRFVIRAGRDYLLYLPPRQDVAYTVLSTRMRHLRANHVALAVEDPNTLRLRADLRHCDLIRIEFDDDRVVELTPSGCPQ